MLLSLFYVYYFVAFRLNIMLSRVDKQFLVRLGSSWKPLFQGRYLLLTNTLSGGGMMMLGDILEQTREIRSEPDRVREWNRTGER